LASIIRIYHDARSSECQITYVELSPSLNANGCSANQEISPYFKLPSLTKALNFKIC